MIFVVNYASRGFERSLEVQNAAWSQLHGDEALRVCSFGCEQILPILRGLELENENEILAVLARTRGDGFWAWKAILVCHVLRNLAREGDVVFYMDSGACPVKPFDELWARIRAHGHLFVRVSATETRSAVREWLESVPALSSRLADVGVLDFSSALWTKPFPPAAGDEAGLPRAVAGRLLGVDGDLGAASARLFAMEQVCGGFQGYLKRGGDDSILADLLANTSLEWFDDEVRVDKPRPFIEHRHDQAILSLIVNAECLANPEFAHCIVDRLETVRLHRGDLGSLALAG